MEFFCVGFVVLLLAVVMAIHFGLPYNIIVYLSDERAMGHAFSHADAALALWARGEREKSRERLHFAIFSATVANTRLRFVTGRWIVEQYIRESKDARAVLANYDSFTATK